MLVLTRKTEERIQIGDNITIKILRVRRHSVQIGIEAPGEVQVLRGELIATPPEPGDRSGSERSTRPGSGTPPARRRSAHEGPAQPGPTRRKPPAPEEGRPGSADATSAEVSPGSISPGCQASHRRTAALRPLQNGAGPACARRLLAEPLVVGS